MNINKKAFSLIELSIVLLIIGIIVAGITQSSRLISAFRLSSARNMTHSSPVTSMRDLLMWYEPTKEYAFATGSAGTYTNIDQPENTNQIARWNDLSPQNSTKIDSIQSTLARQPTYVTNAINNLPAVKFVNASSQYLISSINIDYLTYSEMTFIVVFKRTGAATNQGLFGNGNGSTGGRFVCPTHAYLGGYGVSNGTALTNVTGINALNTPMVFSVIYKNGVSSGSSAYMNGTSIVTFTENQTTNGGTTTAIGGISTVTDYFEGQVAEFIGFSRALKAEERQAIERYLGKKWGIAVS